MNTPAHDFDRGTPFLLWEDQRPSPPPLRIELPRLIAEVFAPPRGSVQYRGLHGGRGPGKSFGAALMAAVWGTTEALRILCTREYQVSIKESFYAEVKGAIASQPFLAEHYDVGTDYIRGKNGTEFLFRGLARNIGSIKSLARIDLTIVEEAEDTSEASWQALEATVLRQPKSEMWVLWNPRLDGSPVDKRFRKEPPKNSIIREINWWDSPFFPDGLNQLRLREMERLDPNTYSHIWEGAYLTNSEAQVFHGKWRVCDFEPAENWDGPYQGGDFGFANDPMAAVRCWIYGDRLFIEHEAGGRGIELDHIGRHVEERIPDYAKYPSYWDSASPGSISLLTRTGMPSARPADKWQGSVDDGIRHLRAFKELIVHPRCVNTKNEMMLYSYKVDKKTGDVMPDLVDANNHWIDAIRYSISKIIKRNSLGYFHLSNRNR